MKRLSLFFFVLLAVQMAGAAPLAFSDSTVVSLITCSPGQEVYARFGHTAVRVNDPVNRIDLVFNYGIFDFSTNNFYVKFIKGETDYKLAAYDFVYFLPEYEERGSWVWEQRLNLNGAEKARLIEALFLNYRPENRVYRYNFVFDNCSTRPRDKLEAALDGRMEYRAQSQPQPFRRWVGEYVGTRTWLKFGIDMIFGDEADRPATRAESMFLPEVLMRELAQAEVVTMTDSGEVRRAVAPSCVPLVQGGAQMSAEPSWWVRPFSVLMVLALLALVLCFVHFSAAVRLFDTVLFVLVALIGCIVFFLDHISLHPLVGDNVNIFWLNPLFLLLAVGGWFRCLAKPVAVLAAVLCVCVVVMFVVYALGMHYSNPAYYPLMAALLFRTASYMPLFQTARAKGTKNQ